MINNILLVYPDAQQTYFEELRNTLEKEFQDDDVEVTVERSVARARQRLGGKIRFDLVVSYIELSTEAGSVPDPEAAFILEDWLRSNEIDIPIVIVVPMYNYAVASRVSHPLSQVIGNDRSLGDSIIRFARERTPPEKQLDIVLSLMAKDENSKWHYTIKGKNFPELKPYKGVLKRPDNLELKNILQYSKDIDDVHISDWKDRVDVLSNYLYRILIDANEQFQMDLSEAVKRVGKLEQTRVQFIVNEEVYPILLEAVLSPELKDHWMAHSPLVRHVSEHRTGRTLFQEEERSPINVLLISSNTSGLVDLGTSGTVTTLPELSNVELECSELKQYLDSLKNEKNINLGKIQIIPSDPEEGIAIDDTKRVLEERRWDIVLYAGHSFLDEESDLAYVFFEDGNGNAEPVEIAKFAGYLMGVRLLILSSCTSSHSSFAFELARYQIPAVLGFRAQIEDDIARRFSADFFRSLFELRSVDGAFFQARKRLYEDSDINHAWTNPVLVLESVA